MYKKIPSIDAYDISEAEYRELCEQPAAQMVVEAVTHYNELVSQSGHFVDKNGKALLLKESEEEQTQAFLDRVFDIVQRENNWKL